MEPPSGYRSTCAPFARDLLAIFHPWNWNWFFRNYSEGFQIAFEAFDWILELIMVSWFKTPGVASFMVSGLLRCNR